MMDDDDWQMHCREFEAIRAAHSNRPLPPGVLETHMALAKARMRAARAEIDRIFEEAKKDPEAWARLHKPL